MKKTLFMCILALIFLSTGIVFASPTAEAPLHIQVYQDNPGQQIPTQALVKEWAAKNNEKVEITVVTNATRLTGVTTALESGAGPDILVLYNVEPQQYSDSLLDLTDIGNELGRENGGWYPIAETYGKVDGKWKMFPVYLLGQMVLYRKDMLADAGVTIPENVSWAQFRQGLVALKSRLPSDVLPFGISMGRSFDGQQFLLARTMAEGGKILSDDGKRIVWNSPESVRALRYMVDLVKDGLMNTDTLSWDDGTNNQAFLSGKIAITFNSNSIKLQAQREFKDLNPNIGTTIMPGGVSYPSPSGFSIRKSTKYPEKAKSLLKYLLSFDSYARTLDETYGAIGCAFKGHAKLDVWTGENETNLLSIPTMKLPGPPSAEMSEAYNEYVFIDQVADVLDKGMTPEQAVQRAADRLQRIYFGN
jgi:multiple sugar transport system substrate-binding protein